MWFVFAILTIVFAVLSGAQRDVPAGMMFLLLAGICEFATIVAYPGPL